MKARCEHCHKEIDKSVMSVLLRAESGKYVCQYCSRRNKRYISLFDLLMFQEGIFAVYGLAAFFPLITGMFNMSLILQILMMVVMVLIIYLGMDYWADYIYAKAPFKQEWKNFTIEEDFSQVRRKVWIIFFAYIFAVLMLGSFFTSSGIIWAYPIMVVLCMAVLALYAKNIYKKEKEYYLSKSGKK